MAENHWTHRMQAPFTYLQSKQSIHKLEIVSSILISLWRVIWDRTGWRGWTCDQQTVGSNPTRGKSCVTTFGQAVHTYVPLSPSSITWYRPRGGDAAGKVTAGLTESNGSLPPGGWLIVTCGLTACTSRSAPGPTLGNEYGKPLFFYLRTLIAVQTAQFHEFIK